MTSMAAAVQAAVQKQQLSEQQQQLTQQQLALAVQAAQNAATIATSSQSVSQSMFFERYVILISILRLKEIVVYWNTSFL